VGGTAWRCLMRARSTAGEVRRPCTLHSMQSLWLCSVQHNDLIFSFVRCI
jgi:hypothetical protein